VAFGIRLWSAKMSDYKPNRGRRPYPNGTLVDVLVKCDSWRGTAKSMRAIEHDGSPAVEVIGTAIGDTLTDWKLEGTTGDILAYRKHEVISNE
jgi:hypothetical protein